MKRLLQLVVVAGMMSFLACGPSAEEVAKQHEMDSLRTDSLMKDSIAKVEAIQKAAKMAKDSLMKDSLMKDSIEKAAKGGKKGK